MVRIRPFLVYALLGAPWALFFGATEGPRGALFFFAGYYAAYLFIERVDRWMSGEG